MDTSQRPLGALEDWTPRINLLKINAESTEQPDINREQRRKKRENEKKLSGRKGKTATGLKEENNN